MAKNVLSIVVVILSMVYLGWRFHDAQVTKDKLVDRADVIGLAQIDSVACPVDGNCKGYTMTVSPIELIKGDLPEGSTIHMQKG